MTANILVVDDDPLVRQYVVRLLTTFGYQVVEAQDGPAAMAVLGTDRPIDLLFTDLVMPGGLDGRQVAEQAQQLRPGLRVLLTSGYSESVVSRPGRPEPEFRLLSKPYRKADLEAAIREALGGES